MKLKVASASIIVVLTSCTAIKESGNCNRSLAKEIDRGRLRGTQHITTLKIPRFRDA